MIVKSACFYITKSKNGSCCYKKYNLICLNIEELLKLYFINNVNNSAKNMWLEDLQLPDQRYNFDMAYNGW